MSAHGQRSLLRLQTASISGHGASFGSAELTSLLLCGEIVPGQVPCPLLNQIVLIIK